MMAEERQGTAGPGFAAPSFNIPFQPNFQFNEFGNFLDGNGGFSQFVAGLGSQGLRQGGGDFVSQTEQRFTRPQIGGAQIGGAPFKRETGAQQPQLQTFHSVDTPSIKAPHHKVAPVRNRPLKRYDYDAADPVRNAELDREPVRMIQHRHKPSGHMRDSMETRNNDRNFHQFHEDDRETDFGFGDTMRFAGLSKMKTDQQDDFELKVESREIFDDHQTNLKTIFDEKSSFNFDFEPEKFPSSIMNSDNKKVEKDNFTPPDMVEKFHSPMRRSEAFSYPEEPKMSKLTKDRMKTFTDFGTSVPNVNSFIDFKTPDIPKLNARAPVTATKPQRSHADVASEKLPTFTNFPKTIRKSIYKKSKPTKKPTKPLSFENIPSFKNFKAYNSPKVSKSSSKPSKKFPSFMNFKPQSPSIPESNNSFQSKPSSPKKSRPSFPTTPSEPVQPFTNFDPQPRLENSTQPPPVFPKMKKLEKKEPELPPMPTMAPETTRKPYNYEKKNFRQPLQQVNKNAGPHQIIRIKAPSRDGRPQPKQLFKTPVSRSDSRSDSAGGFQPIIGRAQPVPPTPGQLLIQEVPSQEAARRYEPSQVVYDNHQPLITLDSVASQGGYRAQSRPDNFAVNVGASFPTNKNKRPVRIQRRLMRLPSSKFSQIINRSPKTMNVATSSSQQSQETNKFESSRILRPRN